MIRTLSWCRAVFPGVMLVIGLLMISCSEENPATIGFSNNTGEYKIVYLDTLTVLTSTVLLDSIKTSGTARILTGEYADAQVGKITSSSFLSVVPPVWEPGEYALFDSIVLILNYDGYYYGDTTSSQKITVNTLSQDLKGRVRKDPYIYNDIPYSYFYLDGGLYNGSITASSADELGSLIYTPHPLSSDSLVVRLDDELGAKWLEMAKKNNDSITLATSFVNYFKGLKISSLPVSSAGAVLGFETSSMKIRVYYRDNLTTGVYEDQEADFKIYNETLQYNQIKTDRTLSLLNGISVLKPVSSLQTNNEAFIQAGAGVLTKLEFPYLTKVFEEEDNIVVTQAQLQVSAVTDEATLDNLPSSLGLYYTNKTNVPIGALASDNDASKSQTATLTLEKEYERKAYYTFSITNYIISALRKNTVAPNDLMIGMPSADFTKTVTRMRIDNKKSSKTRVRLILYYTGYDN